MDGNYDGTEEGYVDGASDSRADGAVEGAPADRIRCVDLCANTLVVSDI